MENIISYSDLPNLRGQSIYLRMETDPKLYITLLSKGYKVINSITEADESTIFVTGRRQDYECKTFDEYKSLVDSIVRSSLKDNGIVKPHTTRFNYTDLIEYRYQIPFVLKNENQNGGREKFLINSEEDYEKLIKACTYLVKENLKTFNSDDLKYLIDYDKYLNMNFTVQEYINTPSKYNTTVRLLTSPSDTLLYGSLKYNKPEIYKDNTSLLGYLLSDVYPISAKSIVSNTLSGGKNILLGEDNYSDFERELLNRHNISSSNFDKIVEASKATHKKYHSELGILCGFDYIYDKENDRWYLLEYHSRPMVGDYSKRQGIKCDTKEDRIIAEGRVRATSLSLVLKNR